MSSNPPKVELPPDGKDSREPTKINWPSALRPDVIQETLVHQGGLSEEEMSIYIHLSDLLHANGVSSPDSPDYLKIIDMHLRDPNDRNKKPLESIAKKLRSFEKVMKRVA